MNYTLKLNSTDHMFMVDEHMVIDRDTAIPLTVYGPRILFDYGEQFQNNYYYLLENYASAEHVNSPVPGMLWMDNNSVNPVLKLYTDDYAWKHVLFDYEDVFNISLTNNTPTINNFIVGDEISVIITNDSSATLNSSKIKWYLDGVLLTTGAISITADVAGVYYATYSYTTTNNQPQVAQSTPRRVIDAIATTADTVGYIDIEIDYMASLFITRLIYPDIIGTSIEWSWYKGTEYKGTGTGTGVENIFQARSLGTFTVTAKYNDTYHLGDNKVTVTASVSF